MALASLASTGCLRVELVSYSSSASDAGYDDASGGITLDVTTASGDGGDGASGDGGYASEVLADKPTAYWRLGESGGATAKDSASGLGTPGAYVGTPTFGVAGAIKGDVDTAVSFTGTSGVDMGDHFAFPGTEPFSLEAWVKPSGGALILCKTDGNAIGWTLTNGSGDLRFQRLRSGSPDAVSRAAIPDGVWTHVVVTYDSALLRLYVDGDLAAAPGTATASGTTSASHFRVGDNGVNSGGAVGGVDEVAVYDHALAAERVAAHFRAATR